MYSFRWDLAPLVLGSVSAINMRPWKNIVIICAGKGSRGLMSTLQPILCGNISGSLILFMVSYLTGPFSATDFCRHIVVEVFE